LLVTLQAVGNEITKNIVLAGIGSLTVLDDALVTEEDCGAQFLISEEDVGKNVRDPLVLLTLCL
jgi:ubiquitin-like 1-activating enzyme E1 A